MIKLNKRKLDRLKKELKTAWSEYQAFSKVGIPQRLERRGKPLRVAHISHYRGNWGDLVLNASIERAWNLLYPQIEWERIEVRNAFPSETARSLGRYDGIVVGGGGLFLPDSNANDISGWQWAISDEDLRQIASPIAIFAVGYNYFRGQQPTNRFIESLKNLAETTSFFGLRNRGSMRAVENIVASDSGITWQPCPTTLINRLWNLPSSPPRGRKIGINIPYDRRQLRYGERENEIMTGIAKACRLLRGQGYRIYVLSHTSDAEFADWLKEEQVAHKVIEFRKMSFLRGLYNYSQFDLVIGGRGHAQMIPFGLGIPILSLDVHDKLGFFLEDIGKQEWLLSLEGSSASIASRISREALDKLNDKPSAQEEIRSIQDKLLQTTNQNIRSIYEIFSAARPTN